MTPEEVDTAARSLEEVGGGYVWIAAWVRHMNGGGTDV